MRSSFFTLGLFRLKKSLGLFSSWSLGDPEVTLKKVQQQGALCFYTRPMRQTLQLHVIKVVLIQKAQHFFNEGRLRGYAN